MHLVFPTNAVCEIDGAEFTYDDNPFYGGRVHVAHAVTREPFRMLADNGALEAPTVAEFEDLLREERAKFVSRLPDDPTRRLAEMSAADAAAAFAMDPKSLKRLAQVQALDDAGVPLGKKAQEQWLAEHWTGTELEEKWGPHDSSQSIRRWRAQRGRVGERKAKQMISMSGRVPRMAQMRAIPIEIMWKHMLRKGAENLSFNNIKAAISAELGQVNDGTHPLYSRASKNYPMPSNSTLRRALRRLKLKIVEVGARGEKAADQDWGGGGKPLTARLAMEKVIVDHTELDLFVVDDDREIVLGRPWLTLAICVATRSIVGHLISFINPSSWTVAEILKRIALPKKPPPKMAARYPILRSLFGRPAELITDNGTEFRSENALAAARGCGVTWRWCPVGKPRYRAIVERALQTVPQRIFEGMPGQTLPIAEARKSDHDAEADAYVTLNELEAVTLQAIAEYNTEPHDGLDGRQPALMFEKLSRKHGIEVFKDLDTALVEFMPFEDPTVLNGAGLRWEGCRYYHAINVDTLLNDLVPLECRRMESERPSVKVRFKYDPLDISRIWVWNRKSKTYVELLNEHENYADGMPLYFHRLVRKAAEVEGAKFNSEAERLEARNRRIEAVKNIDTNEQARSIAAVRKLYEAPRIRELTGNIVHLDYAPVEATVAEFIEHDRASRTSFDVEVMASRPVFAEGKANPKRPRRTVEKDERDRRDAGTPRRGRSPKTDPTEPSAEGRDRRDAGAPRPGPRSTPIADADEGFY